MCRAITYVLGEKHVKTTKNLINFMELSTVEYNACAQTWPNQPTSLALDSIVSFLYLPKEWILRKKINTKVNILKNNIIGHQLCIEKWEKYSLKKKEVEWIRRIPSHGVAASSDFGINR